MSQRLVWPVRLQRQEDGSVLVSFPDIPEALTEGPTEADALIEAGDCLIAALGAMSRNGVPFPARLRREGGPLLRFPYWSRPRSRSMPPCVLKRSATRRLPGGLGSQRGLFDGWST